MPKFEESFVICGEAAKVAGMGVETEAAYSCHVWRVWAARWEAPAWSPSAKCCKCSSWAPQDAKHKIRVGGKTVSLVASCSSPMSSTEIERCWSKLKHVLTKARGCADIGGKHVFCNKRKFSLHVSVYQTICQRRASSSSFGRSLHTRPSILSVL